MPNSNYQNSKEVTNYMNKQPTIRSVDYSALKGEILNIAKQSYQSARNAWSGEECFSCFVMHGFFQHLTHLTSVEVTEVFRSKINEHYQKEDKDRKRCINKQYCFNYGSLQLNNQNSAILSMIHNVINIMSQSTAHSDAQYQTDQALLQLQYEFNCLCYKCKNTSVTQSDKVIQEQHQHNHSPFKSLHDVDRNEQELSKKIKLQCIADFLKTQRKRICESKQKSRLRNQSTFQLYGDILSLDKQRFTQECQCDQNDKGKEKLLSNLMKKNQFNQKEIRRFVRKINSQKSQEKINRPITQEVETKDRSKTFSIKQIVKTPTIPNKYSSKILKRSNDVKAAPIHNVKQTILKFTRMERTLQNALKSCEKQRQKGRSILKNLLINASDLFTEQKKEVVRPNIQKPYFKRLQKILKTSEQMVKCVGIRRLSLEGMSSSLPLSTNS